MSKSSLDLSPEELFAEFLTEEGEENYSPSDLRLLASGCAAVHEARDKPLNAIERYAINSMVAYSANVHDVDEKVVHEIFTTRYNIANPEALPARLYQEAIRFLVDLDLNKIVN